MDEAGEKASNPSFARAARLRVWNRYMDPESFKSGRGVFKDPMGHVSKTEPEVLEQDLGSDFFG